MSSLCVTAHTLVSPTTWFASPRVSTGLAVGTGLAGAAVAMVDFLGIRAVRTTFCASAEW
jgi:hypothetical protein